MMRLSKRTRPSPPRSRLTEEKATDTGIYLLAIGGFYITYQTLHNLAARVGFPDDQAYVVAALADLAILLYSWKAKQEVEQGRSAWFIRLIVALFSAATFSLQLQAAYPHRTSMIMHALPPAVWIIGHEMMLRGKLRRAKQALREREIEQGLRPARLPRTRLRHWILAPRRTFQIWKIMTLWELDRRTVTTHLVETWQADPPTNRKGRTKPVPLAWQWVLATPTPEPEPEADDALNVRLQLLTGGEVPDDVLTDFFAALPDAPEKDGRSMPDARAYVDTVETIARDFGIKPTNVLTARLLSVAPTYITKVKKPRQTVTA